MRAPQKPLVAPTWKTGPTYSVGGCFHFAEANPRRSRAFEGGASPSPCQTAPEEGLRCRNGGSMIDRPFAEHFAAEWIAVWNSHDLEAILAHYADNVVLSCSPPG